MLRYADALVSDLWDALDTLISLADRRDALRGACNVLCGYYMEHDVEARHQALLAAVGMDDIYALFNLLTGWLVSEQAPGHPAFAKACEIAKRREATTGRPLPEADR
jgi:hypothetical protein